MASHLQLLKDRQDPLLRPAAISWASPMTAWVGPKMAMCPCGRVHLVNPWAPMAQMLVQSKHPQTVPPASLSLPNQSSLLRGAASVVDLATQLPVLRHSPAGLQVVCFSMLHLRWQSLLHPYLQKWHVLGSLSMWDFLSATAGQSLHKTGTPCCFETALVAERPIATVSAVSSK